MALSVDALRLEAGQPARRVGRPWRVRAVGLVADQPDLDDRVAAGTDLHAVAIGRRGQGGVVGALDHDVVVAIRLDLGDPAEEQAARDLRALVGVTGVVGGRRLVGRRPAWHGDGADVVAGAAGPD